MARKTTLCRGMMIVNGKDLETGKQKLVPEGVYRRKYGFAHEEVVVAVFMMGDIMDDSVGYNMQKMVMYDAVGKKYINLDDHVQVTLATVNKGHFTKLSGNGNEPRLRLTAPTK